MLLVLSTITSTNNTLVLGKSDEGGYYKTYGSDAEGEKGYLEEAYSKGNHGYKTHDTFHKQDGDKYAFEKHVAYGKARADKKSSHNDEAGSHSSKAGDHEAAGICIHRICTVATSTYIIACLPSC